MGNELISHEYIPHSMSNRCRTQTNLIRQLHGNNKAVVSNVEFNSVTSKESGEVESKHLNIYIFIIYESSSARQVVPLSCSTADPVELNSSC